MASRYSRRKSGLFELAPTCAAARSTGASVSLRRSLSPESDSSRLANGFSEGALAEAGEVMTQASQQALRAGAIVRRLRVFVGTRTGERHLEEIEALVEGTDTAASRWDEER